MLVREPADDLRRVDPVGQVQRHQERHLRLQTLQQVHVVGDGDVLRLMLEPMIIPRGPREPAPRQQAGVRVQDHVVALIADRTQNLPLCFARIGKEPQRLIAVAGEEHAVIALGLAARRLDDDSSCGPMHRCDGRVQADPMTERRDELVDIACRAAANRAPLRAIVHGQHAVVVEEAHQVTRGKLPQRSRARTPDRRAHRHHVVLDELPRVTLLGQVVGQRDRPMRRVEQGGRFAIEAQDVANHAPECRPQQVGTLREQAVERRAVVLQPGGCALHGKGHLARLACNAELFEQGEEVGIGAVVEHDEARVDGNRSALVLHLVSVRVAADVRRGLEHRDFVLAVQVMCRDVACNAAADDGDLHRRASRKRAGTLFRSQTNPHAAIARSR